MQEEHISVCELTEAPSCSQIKTLRWWWWCGMF